MSRIHSLSLALVLALLSAPVLHAQTAPPGMPKPGMPPGMQPKQPPAPPKVAPPPAPRTPQYPLVSALLPYLADETLRAELELSADQKAKLLAHREILWDELYRTADFRASAPRQNEATEAVFTGTLSSDQLRRAVQLAARIAWKERNFTRYGTAPLGPDLTRISLMTLVKYPALSKALDLSPDQRKLITLTPGFTTSFLYLTPDQSEKATELLGKPPAKPLTAEPEPRITDRGNRPEARLIAITASADVRAELKLTEAQTAEMARLRDDWTSSRARILRESPQVQKHKFDVLAAEVTSRLATILQPEQISRLQQLDRRSSLPREDFYYFPEVAQTLGLTDEQKKRIQAATDAGSAAIQKAILACGDPAAGETAVRSAIDAKRKAIAAILTPAQRIKLKEWLGEPFRGSTFEDRVQATMNPSPVEFGLFTNELAYLARNKVVQEALGMTPEQVKAAALASTAIDTRFTTAVLYSIASRGPDRVAYEERSKAIDKAIADVVDAKQRARLDQLMVQARDRLLRRRLDIQPAASAIAYPGVAAAIHLADAQKQQIIDGIDPDFVLSADQRATINRLKAELVQGDLSPPTPRTTLVVQRDGRHTHLLDLPWETLKLSSEEVTKLVPAITRYQLATVPGNVIAELGGDREKLTSAEDALDRAVEIVLSPEQLKRLSQFRFQQAAAISYRTALARPEAKDLAVTPAQLGKIVAAEVENRQWVRLAMRAEDHLPSMHLPGNAFLQLREKLDAQVLAILTPEQRAKWKELTGEPWPEIRKQATFHMGKLPSGSEF